MKVNVQGACAAALLAVSAATAAPTVDPSKRWTSYGGEEILDIHVVPFSYIPTSTPQNSTATSATLTSITSTLLSNSTRHFTWSDNSSFKTWYTTQTPSTRKTIHTLINERRLELATGSYTNCPTYLDLINHLTTDISFLQSTFNYVPRHALLLDDYNLPVSTPAVYGAAGYEGVVVNRINYDEKVDRRQRRELEFWWASEVVREEEVRKGWSGEMDLERERWGREKGVLTHVVSGEGWGVADTCGITPQTCTPYDFTLSSTPPPTPHTLTHLADTLLQQYKAKSQFYSHPHLLIPVYHNTSSQQSLTTQFEAYEMLFQYINSRSDEWGARIKWSSLEEYFRSVRGWEEWRKAKEGRDVLKTFGGDSVPGSDGEGIVWTSYTPNTTLSAMQSRSAALEDLAGQFKAIDLALGSKEEEPDCLYDFAINATVEDCQLRSSVSVHATSIFAPNSLTLLETGLDGKVAGAIHLKLGQTSHFALWSRVARRRREVVELWILLDGRADTTSIDVEVYDAFGKKVVTQLVPDITDDGFFSSERVGVLVDVTLPPVGMSFYTISAKPVVWKDDNSVTPPDSWGLIQLSDLRRYQPTSPDIPRFLNRKVITKEIYPVLDGTVSNSAVMLEFSQEGWIQNLTLFQNDTTRMEIKLEPRMYATSATLSNPSTFQPIFPLNETTYYYPGCDVHKSWKISGPIVERVVVHYGECPIPIGVYTLYHGVDEGVVDVRHSVDMNEAWGRREMVLQMVVGDDGKGGGFMTDVGGSGFLGSREEGEWNQTVQGVAGSFYRVDDLVVVPVGGERKIVMQNFGGPTFVARFGERVQWMVEKRVEVEGPKRRGWRWFRVKVEGGDVDDSTTTWRDEVWMGRKPVDIFEVSNVGGTKLQKPVSFWKGGEEDLQLVGVSVGGCLEDGQDDVVDELCVTVESGNPQPNWEKGIETLAGVSTETIIGLDGREGSSITGNVAMVQVKLSPTSANRSLDAFLYDFNASTKSNTQTAGTAGASNGSGSHGSAGTVLAGLLIGVMCVGGVVWFWRKRKEDQSRGGSAEGEYGMVSGRGMGDDDGEEEESGLVGRRR
ncbi:Alpha-mannosidase 2 [Rhizophlyctis rosea]|nr:Alpha-mannosidase 2 [Rhizophlyctis rosea]